MNEFQFVMQSKRVMTSMFTMLRIQCHHISVIIATTSSYCYHSDVIETSFCQGLTTTVGYIIVAMVTDLWRHLTYDSKGAWHAPLPAS